MKTIVEPKQHIDKLWGKQEVEKNASYRLMKYVLRVDYENQVLLHNVITGQLVALDDPEAEMVSNLPMKFDVMMKGLVSDHYLVPESYNEYQQLINLRGILCRLKEVQNGNYIQNFTILPTTACNARCYYCFEQGTIPVTMSEQTANDVVKFIVNHCREKSKIHLSWFGGEPTVASHRIDQICNGLQKEDIQYWSDMTTNGYLFDEEMAIRAASVWHMRLAMISVDGTKDNYNKVKSFVNAEHNPYERVMRNIGLLLEQGIRVNLRMNFDLGNYHDFYDLCDEAMSRFQKNPLLQVYVHPVVGNYPSSDGTDLHGNDTWFSEQIVALNEVARKASLYREKDSLPSLQIGCMASRNSAITINADGTLVKCPEQFGKDQIVGDLYQGLTNTELIHSWKEFEDYPKCVNCEMFPYCARIKNCSAKERCNYQKEIHRQLERAICRRYEYWTHKGIIKQ